MTDKKIKDKILQKLNEYNEIRLDEGYTNKKVKKSRKGENVTIDTKSTHRKINSRKKKKERKIRQREKTQHEAVPKEDKNSDSNCKLTGEKRTLHELTTELGLKEFEKRLESDKQSDGSDNKSSSVKLGPEIVVYENPSKRKRKTDKLTKYTKRDGNTDGEFDMKRARYEVRKFGIKGFQGNKKDEAMVALLVQLGAKPPKNKFYNYKEFTHMKKEEKETQKKQREIDRSLGYKVAPNRGQRRQKDRNDVGGFVDGQVGKYKDGIQFVKRADLKGFKNVKRK